MRGRGAREGRESNRFLRLCPIKKLGRTVNEESIPDFFVVCLMDPRVGAMPMSTDRQVVVAHACQVVDVVVVVAAVDEVVVGATTQRRCSK